MITLENDDDTTIELHADLLWSDEYSWSPVEQTATRGITGTHIVQVQQRTGGRPITLEPEDDASAWMPRSILEILRSWASVPGMEMTLTLREVTHTVIFRHHEGGAIQATPVLHYDTMEDSDFYRVTLRFMEI
jgi:hypothetical protein